MKHYNNLSDFGQNDHIYQMGLIWTTQAKIRLSHLFPTYHGVINEFLNGSSLLPHFKDQWLKSQMGIQSQSLSRETGGTCSITDRALSLKRELYPQVPPAE